MAQTDTQPRLHPEADEPTRKGQLLLRTLQLQSAEDQNARRQSRLQEAESTAGISFADGLDAMRAVSARVESRLLVSQKVRMSKDEVNALVNRLHSKSEAPLAPDIAPHLKRRRNSDLSSASHGEGLEMQRGPKKPKIDNEDVQA